MEKPSPVNHTPPPEEMGFGKDELNLAEFPIAMLTEQAPKDVKTLEFKDQIYDAARKKILNRKLIIEGSETYGLPTAKDDEVILALIQLSKRKRFQAQTLDFTRYELISILGWANTGQSYKRVELALRRWVSVTLHYENAWWDKSEERWTSGAFHILDDFELNDSRETSPQMTLLTSRIVWSNRIFNSFVEGHLKNIRYDLYIQLKSSISKRMYRFLDKRFYHGRSCSFELRDFAHEHIGLSRSYRDCGKLKEKLHDAITELERIGFLETLPVERRFQQEGKGRWKVTFIRGGVKPLASAAVELPLNETQPELIDGLVKWGVTLVTAKELVESYATELIAKQLEHLEWMIEKRPAKVGDSGAYLVDAIRKDYAAPKGFISKAERQRVAEAKAAKEKQAHEQKREEQAQKQKKNQELAAIEGYWQSLSKEQQQALQAAADASTDTEQLKMEQGPFKKMGQRIRREEYIRLLLQGELDHA